MKKIKKILRTAFLYGEGLLVKITKNHIKSRKIKEKFEGISLHWDRGFIKNIISAVGLISVWRGLWSLLDLYFFPGTPLLSYVLSVILGIFLLYLPDGSFRLLGHYEERKK